MLLHGVLPATAQLKHPTVEVHPNHTIPFAVPAGAIVYGVLAQNINPFQHWNHELKQWIKIRDYGSHPPLESYLQWAPAVAVYAMDLGKLKARNTVADRSAIYLLTLILEATPVYFVKKISHETRPNGQGDESFPSGHTANAFAAAEFLRHELGYHSVWITISGYLCASAVAALRLYHNRHWLGDVVSGAGIGVLSADLAYYLFPVLKKAVFSPNRSNLVMAY